MDKHQEHLKGSDLFTIEATGYRLIKSYRLKMKGNASIQAMLTEMKDLKADGWELEVGLDDGNGQAVMQAIKVVDLTELEQLKDHLATAEAVS